MCLCSKKNKIKWRSWAWTPLPEGRVMDSDPAGPKDTHTNPQDQIATYIVLFLQFCSTISSNRTICLIGSSGDSPLQRTFDVRFRHYKSAFIYSNTHHHKGDRSVRLCRWRLCIWDWTSSLGTALGTHIHRSNNAIFSFNLLKKTYCMTVWDCDLVIVMFTA